MTRLWSNSGSQRPVDAKSLKQQVVRSSLSLSPIVSVLVLFFGGSTVEELMLFSRSDKIESHPSSRVDKQTDSAEAKQTVQTSTGVNNSDRHDLLLICQPHVSLLFLSSSEAERGTSSSSFFSFFSLFTN